MIITTETSVYTVDDVYGALLEVSDKLDTLNIQMDSLDMLGEELLQFLQSSDLSSVPALLLILVGFEIIRLVRGWVKGGGR